MLACHGEAQEMWNKSQFPELTSSDNPWLRYCCGAAPIGCPWISARSTRWGRTWVMRGAPAGPGGTRGGCSRRMYHVWAEIPSYAPQTCRPQHPYLQGRAEMMVPSAGMAACGCRKPSRLSHAWRWPSCIYTEVLSKSAGCGPSSPSERFTLTQHRVAPALQRPREVALCC